MVTTGPPAVLPIAKASHVSSWREIWWRYPLPLVFNTHVGVVGARVVDATHIAIQWGNFTAAANIPPAGTYQFLVQRQ